MYLTLDFEMYVLLPNVQYPLHIRDSQTHNKKFLKGLPVLNIHHHLCLSQLSVRPDIGSNVTTYIQVNVTFSNHGYWRGNADFLVPDRLA